MGEVVTNPATRHRYLVSSLMEEAITSSQLEGASTTGRVAKEMLRTGREPRDKSERMIANNYRAMELIRERGGKSLSPSLVRELHAVVTSRTLDDPETAGVLQVPGERRVQVLDQSDGTILHTPPPAEQLPERFEALCRFANGGEAEGFLHPVLRAIIIHFWLAYDHPFVDGNGRTARVLFYWAMLRQGYWLAEFLSISKILKSAPARYARSFLYTETDDADLTYFILYQLEVIQRAIEELEQYLQRKMAEVNEIEAVLKRDSDLNYRQIALIGHALRHTDATYTLKSHGTSHGITHETARTDLAELAQLGLLVRTKRGRTFNYLPPDNLPERLRGIGRG